MRTTKKQILLALLFSWVLSQQAYRSVESIQSEWKEYTSYQKEERVSFCDFLFKEGYYERCLLTAFQILYQYPDDPINSTINYYIGRCYEEMQIYNLAHQYYRQVIQKDPDS